MSPSASHLVLVNAAGSQQDPRPVIIAAAAQWQPVWVVVDPRADTLPDLSQDGSVRLVRLKQPGGRGAAIRHALLRAERAGFSHALVMGPGDVAAAGHIAEFMAVSVEQAGSVILGQNHDPAGLAESLCNLLVALETGFAGIGDAQCGFRVYPIRALLETMAATRWMRGREFEAESAVRLCWRGVPPIRKPVAGTAGNGGLFAWMHARLLWHLITRR